LCDPERAADHFFHMPKGNLHFRALLGMAKQPPETEVKRHVADCVEVFLRAYTSH
jgi:TetR/AcrR family transcriptional regulator, mexJK operon transcriptional repressor